MLSYHDMISYQVGVLAGLSEDQLLLGRVQPYWVPDSDAGTCMICGLK